MIELERLFVNYEVKKSHPVLCVLLFPDSENHSN